MDAFLVEGRFGFLGQRQPEAHRALLAQGWRLARSHQATDLWVRGEVRVRDVAGGWVVGELFERGSGRQADPVLALRHADGEALDARFDRLVQEFWGRYVAIFPEERALLRDPSGHLDCLTWSSSSAWLAGSALPSDLPAVMAPRGLAICWPGVAAMLRDESGTDPSLGLLGVSQLLPGTSRRLASKTVDRVVWHPARFALEPHCSYDVSRRAMAEAVEESLAAEGGSAGRLLVEISGGLDSAIVTGTLARLGAVGRACFVHFHIDDPGGDERRFARAVAAQAGVELLEVVKPELRIGAGELASMPIGVRPSNTAIDRHYDQTQADLAERFGVDRLLTGQGGDMVFFQSPSRGVGSELWGRWARRPRADPLWRQLEDAARWNRCSVWSLLGEAVREAWRPQTPTPDVHPWLDTAVAPAKQRQISSLIRSQLFHGASLRGARAHLIHPLLHQPVLEAALAAPVIDLARGGRGRSLARDVFSDRIPELVRTRRSKGDLTAYYGRMVLRSLDVLTPFLLDGRLAQAGVLDRAATERFLDPDRMIHEGDYPRLFQIVALEAYVRHWEGRIADFEAAAGPGAGAASRSASQGRTSA
jgi:asparagine synthase (glutamine-hydrolysing)